MVGVDGSDGWAWGGAAQCTQEPLRQGSSAEDVELQARLADAVAAGSIIDTREAAQFAAAHLVNASSFPLSELRERLAELPPTHGSRLRVMADSDAALAVAVGSLVGAAGNERGWNVVDSFVASPHLWTVAKRMQTSLP